MDKIAGNSEISSAPEVTARLLREYHVGGDSSARARLIELYMPLVASVARRYSRGGNDYEDLVQVGSIGLIKAIDRFDLNRGAELASFAVPNISGEIKRHLRDRGDTVRLPREMSELRGRVGGARDDLTARLGREPSPAELAAEVGADESTVTSVLSALRGVTEGDAEPDFAVASATSPEDRLALMEAFEGLDERERRIVYLRYVRDLDQEEVARELGISKRHLSRQTRAALEKLRRGLQGGPVEDSEPNMAPMESVTPYLDRPYHITLVRSDDESGWIAQVEELPGCEVRAESADEATRAIRDAMEAWIAEALETGREVPEPRGAASYSGRLMLRMPHSLHAELARAAERDEVSLNQFITSSLASVVGWRRLNGEGPVEPVEEAAAPAQGRRRLLLLNAILLGIVGVAAVVLLVVALTQGS